MTRPFATSTYDPPLQDIGNLCFAKDDQLVVAIVIAAGAANIQVTSSEIPLLSFFKLKELPGLFRMQLQQQNAII